MRQEWAEQGVAKNREGQKNNVYKKTTRKLRGQRVRGREKGRILKKGGMCNESR